MKVLQFCFSSRSSLCGYIISIPLLLCFGAAAKILHVIIASAAICVNGKLKFESGIHRVQVSYILIYFFTLHGIDVHSF